MTLKIRLDNVVDKEFNGIQIGGKNENRGFNGIQIGGVNISDDKHYAYSKGIQTGFLGNFADELRGVQLCCMLNFCDSLLGLQVAFMGNSEEGGKYGYSTGVQAAMINDAESFEGVQLGMQNNAYGYFKGLQIGMQNKADKGHYLQIGFLNRKVNEPWYKAHVFWRYNNER